MDALVGAIGRLALPAAAAVENIMLIDECCRQRVRAKAAGLTSRGTMLDTAPDLIDAHIAGNLESGSSS